MTFSVIFYFGIRHDDNRNIAWAKAGQKYLETSFHLSVHLDHIGNRNDVGCEHADNALLVRTQQGPIILCANGTPDKPTFKHVSFVTHE